MPKVLSASIRLVQKKNRMNRNGEYPIYIVISFNGRVEKTTGVSVGVRHWDAKREIIKPSCPNAPVLNKILSDIKQRCIDRKNEYEIAGKSYVPAMLLKDSIIDFSAKDNLFSTLSTAIMNERRLKEKTCCKYRYALKKLRKYFGRDNVVIDELTTASVKAFCDWLTVNDSTKRDICSCIASVWNYAIKKKMVSKEDYPFNDFRFTFKYKSGVRVYYLEKVHMKMLYDYWLDMVIEWKSENMWTYKDGVFERLRKRSSAEFSILWFLLCYKLNGSAPIEIAMLKGTSCKRISIDGQDFWAIDFKRQKTNTDVHVRLKRDVFSIIGLEHFLGTSTNGYVYPIVRRMDRNILRQSWKASETCILKVREALKVLNGRIIQDNVDKGSETPLIDVESVVYYTARHSFASHYLNSPGSTVNGLASLMARGVSTIGTYVHQLTQDKEIAEAVEVLSF